MSQSPESDRLILAFLPASSNGLSFRGTEVAMLSYMDQLQTVLKHVCILCLGRKTYNEPVVFKTVENKYPIVWFSDENDLEEQLQARKVDALYSIRSSPTSGITLKSIPMLIHCVYEMKPRGNELVCAGVSLSVAGNDGPFVPHMVCLKEVDGDYRKIMGIPETAIVFGRHGGADTFDIPFVRTVILRLLTERPDIYFLFAVRPRLFMNISHPRLICLEPFADPGVKRKFINTMDAFIHAQTLGETFGLSCAEASQANKPVIVWSGGKCREHLRILGKDKCIKYDSADDLYKILSEFNSDVIRQKDWKAYDDYTPDKVMRQFDSVFLETLREHIKNKLLVSE